MRSVNSDAPSSCCAAGGSGRSLVDLAARLVIGRIGGESTPTVRIVQRRGSFTSLKILTWGERARGLRPRRRDCQHAAAGEGETVAGCDASADQRATGSGEDHCRFVAR